MEGSWTTAPQDPAEGPVLKLSSGQEMCHIVAIPRARYDKTRRVGSIWAICSNEGPIYRYLIPILGMEDRKICHDFAATVKSGQLLSTPQCLGQAGKHMDMLYQNNLAQDVI